MADEKSESKLFARITGYTIIILSCITFGSVICMIFNHFVVKNRLITVYFPKIGELRVEQPFLLNGLSVGEIVKTDENVYDGVAVTIKLTRNIHIRQGYQIYCSDVGLFGTKREVVLINGPESAPILADSQKLKGSYYIGMTELISSMWKLQRAVTMFSKKFNEYLSGDGQALKLISTIENLDRNAEIIASRISNIAYTLDITLPEAIEKTVRLSEESKRIVQKGETKIPEIRRDLESVISTVDTVLEVLPGMIEKVEKASDKVDSLNNKDSLKPVLDKLKSMQTQFDYVRENAHRLLLILRKYE